MSTENDSAKRNKPFYRNVDDTLEDVGITRRQLGYWRKQGLFNPELGPTTKFFTEVDTKQLQFLKRLIEDLGLPVATVKRLLAPTSYWSDENKIAFWGPDFVPPADHFTFIDVEQMRLVQPAEAMSKLVAAAMVGRSEYKVEQLLEPTILLALRSAWMRSANLDIYEAHIKSLHARLERIDMLSRLRIDAAGQFRFWPERNTDPDLTDDLIEQLTEEKKHLESTLNAARERLYWE